MNEVNFERVNASFRVAIGGVVTTPAPEAVLIKDQKSFSAYLSSPMRFFDGRFMFYEKYEGASGFFEEHDLIAVIVKGEASLISLELGEEAWLLRLEVTEGAHALYFLPVPKENLTKVELL